MKIYLIALSLFLSLSFSSFSRNVMTWVPVYGIDGVKNILNDPTQSSWIKNGVTHIGLQFWVPGDSGEVAFITDYQFTYKASTISQDVQDFVTWGHANNIKIMMCFHNVREHDFDWGYARKVIDTFPSQTATNVMQIVNAYGLDGVDIDFEGIGDFSTDKPAFVNFLNTLGTSLHAVNKELSVDMFSTPCYNAPNPSWESAMSTHVDFMNVMGYNDTYENNNTLFSYCPQTPSEANTYPFRYSYIENFLTTKQGVSSSKLNYGLPAWMDTWGGQCAQNNILDIMDVSTAGGIAIWYLQLNGGPFWASADTWNLIKLFKEDYTSAQIRSQLSSICGTPTSITDGADAKASLYYVVSEQSLHLPSTTGDLYLYSAAGVQERSWRINGEENISFADVTNGFHIVKFKTPTGIYSTKISLFK